MQMAFVPQDDNLLGTLTVAECLTYSALLRLPSSLTPEQVQASGAGRGSIVQRPPARPTVPLGTGPGLPWVLLLESQKGEERSAPKSLPARRLKLAQPCFALPCPAGASVAGH